MDKNKTKKREIGQTCLETRYQIPAVYSAQLELIVSCGGAADTSGRRWRLVHVWGKQLRRVCRDTPSRGGWPCGVEQRFWCNVDLNCLESRLLGRWGRRNSLHVPKVEGFPRVCRVSPAIQVTHSRAGHFVVSAQLYLAFWEAQTSNQTAWNSRKKSTL